MPSLTEPAEDQPYRANEVPPAVRRGQPMALFLIAVCVLLIFIAQTVKPWADAQMMNMLSYVLGAIAIIAAVVWLLRREVSPWARWLPLSFVAAAVAVFFAFYRIAGVSGELVPRFEPRFAERPAAAVRAAGLADLTQQGEQDFPGFLGTQRDGVIDRRQFGTDWTQAKELWRQPLGPAWSGFAIVGDFAVTMEQRGEGEQSEQWVSCYRLRDGGLVWYHASPGGHYNPLGGTGPRSTPTIFNGRVYAQSALGQVVCLDGTNGQRLWELDLFQHAGLTQLEAELAVTWGRAGSPLIVQTDDADTTGEAMVVLPYGGPLDAQRQDSPIGSLISLDADTGAVRWIGGETQISYASPVLATLDGQRQIVSVNESNVTGHSILDGRVLWEEDWPGASNGGATCSNPVVYGDDGLLLAKGYGGGSKLLRIDSDAAAGQRVQIEWADARLLKTKFTHAVIDGDYAYGLSDGTLECVDLRQPRRTWRQPRGTRYGQGQILRVEDVLVVQAESGEVALVRCDPERYQELARLPGLSSNTWNYPAIAGRHLLVRDAREAVAYELPLRETVRAATPVQEETR